MSLSILFLLQFRDNKTIIEITVNLLSKQVVYYSAPSIFELQRNIRLSTRESGGKT